MSNVPSGFRTMMPPSLPESSSPKPPEDCEDEDTSSRPEPAGTADRLRERNKVLLTSFVFEDLLFHVEREVIAY